MVFVGFPLYSSLLGSKRYRYLRIIVVVGQRYTRRTTTRTTRIDDFSVVIADSSDWPMVIWNWFAAAAAVVPFSR